ncbi:hypothetical protein ACC848_42415, partial [Rhizobium johnstonii]
VGKGRNIGCFKHVTEPDHPITVSADAGAKLAQLEQEKKVRLVDAGAKLAQLEQEKKVRLADATAYLKELPRDVDTTIGVGPVE